MTSPHFLNPKKETVRAIFIYKNFAAFKGISHIGLGVSVMNTAKVLSRNGLWGQVEPAVSPAELDTVITRIQTTAITNNEVLLSHVIISAAWIPTQDMSNLIRKWTNITFIMLIHSNVGFLQADSNGVKLLREAFILETSNHNFHVAGNCQKFATWVRNAYNVPCLCLPNLYDTQTVVGNNNKTSWKNGTLRIGCFGAYRPLKNIITAAGAALEIANKLKVNLEFWTNGGRDEGGSATIRGAVHGILMNLPGVKEIESNWQSWPEFRKTVGHMHLLLQPSYTESFNICTADGIAEGVASVVSHAIDWVPPEWQGNADDTSALAHIGIKLLNDPKSAKHGLDALNKHVHNGTKLWEQMLLTKV